MDTFVVGYGHARAGPRKGYRRRREVVGVKDGISAGHQPVFFDGSEGTHSSGAKSRSKRGKTSSPGLSLLRSKPDSQCIRKRGLITASK